MKKQMLVLAATILMFSGLIAPSASNAATAMCKRGFYENSAGRCVQSPQKSAKAPAGASAKCRDGSYSFSQSRSGTCSHHGGVASWL